jgi:hypothetical protein
VGEEAIWIPVSCDRVAEIVKSRCSSRWKTYLIWAKFWFRADG